MREYAPDRHLFGRERDEVVALVEHHRLRRHHVLGHAELVPGGDDVREHAVELVDRPVHGLLELLSLIDGVGQIHRDQLGIAVGHEPVAAPLEIPALAPVVGELAVVDHRRRR